VFYFGSWPDPQAALREYQEFVKANEGNDRPPTAGKSAATISQLCNTFFAHQEARVAAKDISHRTFTSLHRTAKLMVGHWGRQRRVATLMPIDFREFRIEQTKRLTPIGVTNEVTRTKQFFHWGEESDLIDHVKFGTFRTSRIEFPRISRAALKRGREPGTRGAA
jgi:hypothetical protein